MIKNEIKLMELDEDGKIIQGFSFDGKFLVVQDNYGATLYTDEGNAVLVPPNTKRAVTGMTDDQDRVVSVYLESEDKVEASERIRDYSYTLWEKGSMSVNRMKELNDGE